jgi:DNA-binding response OmpR family regulator
MGDFSGIDVSTLTRTELTILEFLVEARHRTTSNSVLTEIVYSQRPDGGPDDAYNVVRQTVRRLRAKLAGQGWTIQTLWGVGYRLARLDDGKAGA